MAVVRAPTRPSTYAGCHRPVLEFRAPLHRSSNGLPLRRSIRGPSTDPRRPVVLPMAAPIRAAAALPLQAVAPRHMVPAAALRLFQWLHHIARCRCVAHSGLSATARGQVPHRGRPLQAVPEAAPTLALPLRRPVGP